MSVFILIQATLLVLLDSKNSRRTAFLWMIPMEIMTKRNWHAKTREAIWQKFTLLIKLIKLSPISVVSYFRNILREAGSPLFKQTVLTLGVL